MSEWGSVTLGYLSTQRKGINYKSEDYGDAHSGHPFITIKCFVKGGGYEPTGIKFYDGFSTKADHLTPGDILFSVTDLTRAGDIVGSPLRVPDFGGAKPALASMDCMRIDPIVDRCNKEFLYHRMMLSDVRRQMVAYSAGSTVLHLDTKKVPSISVLAPLDVRTQAKIAAILTSIDTAIEKTEALIEKYQQIKAGLMHDLFTRGVLPNGQLRPPRTQAAELYQQTEIGWIPKDWKMETLRTACDWYSGGTPSKRNEEWWKGSLPWLSPKDMKHFELADTEDHITRQAASFGSRIAPKDSVFIVVRGMILAHSFPVVLNRAEFAFNQDVKAVIAQSPLMNRYLAYWFVANTGLFLKKTTESTHGTKRFDLNDIYSIEIGVPSVPEQQRVIDRLDTIEKRICTEIGHRDKLRAQKLGLMQDLLTGRVPVTVDSAMVGAVGG